MEIPYSHPYYGFARSFVSLLRVVHTDAVSRYIPVIQTIMTAFPLYASSPVMKSFDGYSVAMYCIVRSSAAG